MSEKVQQNLQYLYNLKPNITLKLCFTVDKNREDY